MISERRHGRRPKTLPRSIAGLLLATGGFAAAAPPEPIDEIVVTSDRRGESLFEHTGNIERLDATEIAAVRHQHIHELLTRVPGVWLGRGSGQEHLTAIRSPVLTGAGSCGAFLFLEDGIPTRPSGFCNVNQLFESNTELAESIEVIRGPGNALYGSNALHGIVNVLLPEPGPATGGLFGAEVGANEFVRVRARVPFDGEGRSLGSIVFADDGGFRDESGYRQLKGNLKLATSLFGGDFTGGLSFTDLDQETAGFIFGEDAYRDPDLNRENLNPEAFREAQSQRLYGIWRADIDGAIADVRPYLRHSNMTFLQHFLPGQPLEENGHVSAGVIASLEFGNERRQIVTGVDVEWSDVFLKETQFGPTEGSAFLQETRPEGKHYDYEVTSIGVAPFVQADFSLSDTVTLSVGLRAEYLHYDYDNRMLDGNTRDDGTPCGFGGCLYTRPADRSDDFTNLAPKLALNVALSDTSILYGIASRGFRAPQMTELYRLQSGQTVADLDSERIDSLELGWRGYGEAWSLDTAVFAMSKRDSVFRDAEGFNVSGARSRHAGIEVAFDWQILDRLRLAIDATYARHEYDFDRVAARGETFISGRDVDTAPRFLGSAELFFDALDTLDFGLQWTAIGRYYLDAENRFDYPGHDILNLRASLRPSETLAFNLRLNNVTDTAYADRADYAFGNYRYFPGRGRELFVELVYSPAPGSRESL
ncbi:MAG: TonB-dependent receptor [Woeseiaceae bacterium]|nr:TonB-dependent receptor [Woeseiaceae bacterium]